jgi:hypothetical protein
MAELGYQEGRNFTFDYIQTSDIEGYEKNYRELAAHKVDVFLAVKRAGAACRAFGRGREADRVSGRRFRSSGEGICGEPVASRGQRDRHFRTPARVGRQARRDCSRGVPACDPRRYRI